MVFLALPMRSTTIFLSRCRSLDAVVLLRGTNAAQMHLIYAGFMTKALRDLEATTANEPFYEPLSGHGQQMLRFARPAA